MSELECPVDGDIKVCEGNIVALDRELQGLHERRKRAFPLCHSPCHSPCQSPFVNPFLSLCLAVLLDMREMFYERSNCAMPAWVAARGFNQKKPQPHLRSQLSRDEDEDEDEEEEEEEAVTYVTKEVACIYVLCPPIVDEITTRLSRS
eukprot:COSAG01_NODE_1184_length_11346_cov_58.600249_7_plen_148_part_00